MSSGFQIRVDGDVVIVTHVGHLEFEQTNHALASAVEAARAAGTNLVLIDHRRADTSNYYSYVVRHAEMAPQLGLDQTYKLAFLGLQDQLPVLDFIVTVTRNRGWQAHCFVDMTKAVRWLRGPDAPEHRPSSV